MNILIKRFPLRYNGKDYTAGTILTLPSEEGHEILRIADGEVEEIDINNVAHVEAKMPVTEEAEKADSGEEKTSEESLTLPPVDPRRNFGKRKK